MSNGILCKYCGWQETDHLSSEGLVGTRRRLAGYKRTLYNCTGFVGETEPPEVSDGEMSHMERVARARAAWGQYASQVRQNNFDLELRQHDTAINHASGEARERAIRKRAKFISKAESQNHGFYVG